MAIEYLKSSADFDKYIQLNPLLVAYFTASWCGPCQAIAPVVEQLYTKFSNVEIVKIDIDKSQDVARKNSISAVPTLIFYKQGKVVNKVQGANVPGISSALESLSKSLPDAKRVGLNAATAATAEASKTSTQFHSIEKYIPKGFEILNSFVFTGDLDSLNTASVNKNCSAKEAVKSLFSVDNLSKINPKMVLSDTDAQILLYIPLTNHCKIHSLLLKSSLTNGLSKNLKDKAVDQTEEEELFKDSEYDYEETQKPSKIKIWSNRSSILSFEDAESLSALHSEQLFTDQWDANGWAEVKVRYVRFQNTSSLIIFLDGSDEDFHTVLEKIVLIGVSGESKDQGKIEKNDGN